MIPHNYIGFTNDICQCEYLTGNVNGEEVLIIKQTTPMKTSITNVIEVIVRQLLAGDLFGTNPEKLRIFEFYPKSLAPMVGWQEVSFADMGKRQPRMSFLEKIKDFFKPTEQPYYVDKPQWGAVPTSLQAQLVALAPNDLV